tara:strand:+ start:12862 stop:13173 length:312 start_codon:yes stop_codon:yes gene_type:complete
MPSYDFENSETGCIEERFMSYKVLDQFKKDNPHLKQVILTAPVTTGGIGDRVKIDGGFKEVLSNVGKAYPGSDVDRKYNGMGVKESKTREVVRKHIKLQNKGK